jgi:hypothetical protein
LCLLLLMLLNLLLRLLLNLLNWFQTMLLFGSFSQHF